MSLTNCDLSLLGIQARMPRTKQDSIVSEDQIGQRTVELSSETELKCDSSTKTKLTQQIREERIYLL